jgi:hypothetical protein
MTGAGDSKTAVSKTVAAALLSGMTGDPMIDASFSFCDNFYDYDHGDLGSALDRSRSTRDVDVSGLLSTPSNPLFGAFDDIWASVTPDDDDDGQTNFDSGDDATSITDDHKPVQVQHKRTQAQSGIRNNSNAKEDRRQVVPADVTKKADPEAKVSSRTRSEGAAN